MMKFLTRGHRLQDAALAFLLLAHPAVVVK